MKRIKTKKMTISEVRNRLSSLSTSLKANHVVKVTRRDEPVLAIMRWDDYSGLLATMEILSDDEAVRQFRSGVADIKAGRVIPWEEARKQLGW